MSTVPVLQIPQPAKHKMAELASKAKSLGMTPERYVQRLIEEDLALDRKARTAPFARLMGPGRSIDEAEIDRVVDQARTRHHQRTSKRKR